MTEKVYKDRSIEQTYADLEVTIPKWLGFSCLADAAAGVLESSSTHGAKSLHRDHQSTHSLEIDSVHCIRVTELLHPDKDSDISVISFGYIGRGKRPHLAIHMPLPWLFEPLQKNNWTIKYMNQYPQTYMVYDYSMVDTMRAGQKATEVLRYY